MEKSLPALASLHNWLTATRAKTTPGGAAAKALDYSLRRWPAFSRYAETGHLPIDNNLTENCIRPIAVGKKNWMFVGSERAAAIQTLLGTAKLNGLNPAAWLKNTLEKLPTWPNSRIDELLPLDRHFLKPLNITRPDHQRGRVVRLRYTDYWEAYTKVFPESRHITVGKDSGFTNLSNVSTTPFTIGFRVWSVNP